MKNKNKSIWGFICGMWPFGVKRKMSKDIVAIQYKEIPFRTIGRRTGNTTRLVDQFIQDLFIYGECKVYDHYPTRQASMMVYESVLKRLRNEHNHVWDHLEINKSRLTIRLKNFNK